jgi:hypothetical protein
MSDQFTQVTSTSWLSRMGGSFKGMLMGLGLLLGAFVLLWWNEGRAVQTAKSLDEGQGMVKSVPSDKIDPSNEGKLVHTSGMATTTETLNDTELGFVAPSAIKLNRKVEMFQWVESSKSETRKKMGGGEETVTTYSYERKWNSGLTNSDNFNNKSGHNNPKNMPYSDKSITAQKVTLGAYQMSQGLISSMSNSESVPYTNDMMNTLSDDLKSRAVINGSELYIGSYSGSANPNNPQIGDIRVTYEVTKPATVTVIARQTGTSFEPYATEAGDDLQMLSAGQVSSDAMFKSAIEGNNMMTWILRIVGYFLMFFGLRSLFGPIATMGDVVPLIGNILGYGIGIFSGVIAAIFSVVTIAIAWFFYRPVLSISLIVIGLAIFLVPKFLAKRKAAAASQPTA